MNVWIWLILYQDAGLYLKNLIPPVLTCFYDQDSRVRYYACEALYNIAKVARGSVLPFFNDVFDGLSKVSTLCIMKNHQGIKLRIKICFGYLVKRSTILAWFALETILTCVSVFTHHSLAQVASQLLQNGTYLYGHVCASTHGQKSWDICRICLNSHTHQTKSHTSLKLVPCPFPYSIFNMERYTSYAQFLLLSFNIALGWRGGNSNVFFKW